MNESRFKKVCMIGLGYIGLPTAAVFASSLVLNGLYILMNNNAKNTEKSTCSANPDLLFI